MYRMFLGISLVMLICSTSLAGELEFPWDWAWKGNGHAARVSSYDKTGGNVDAIQIKAGETAVIADIDGPGVIRRIWFTTNAPGPIERMIVIRMYWDGSDTPAVEVPYGDFFGVGNSLKAEVNSWPITVVCRGKSKNCWWPMPFAKGAKITITNESPEPLGAFYFHICYLALDKKPKTKLRFYSQYRQAYPADFPENYTILETTGKGQYMGCIMSVEQTKSNWWGEGDEVIIADDYEALHGTGSEEYFGDAWGMHTHSTLWHGSPLCEGFSDAGMNSSMYRFHIVDPIPFNEKISVTIEHGTENDRADNISSVAFWYQKPHASDFPALPPVVDRLPGKYQADFIRMRAWQLAAVDEPDKVKNLKELLLRAKTDENILLLKGLHVYSEAKENPSENSMEKLNTYYQKFKEMVKAQPDGERYTKPIIDIPTDDDNLIPSQLIKSYRILERSKYDLARITALKKGFEPDDELIIEVRDSNGILNKTPSYTDSADFTNSYAKVDDTHLMGNGARFTYGNSDPSFAKFIPDIPKTGKYEVLVLFSYGSNASDTRYEVRYAGQKEKVIELQQRGRPGTPDRNNGMWHSLGVYKFMKGLNPDSGSVTLNAAPGTSVPNDKFEYRAYADSVRFVYQGD